MAAFEARDRQDFAKGGAKTKIIRHMAAFWNSVLQANVKLAQAFKNRPLRTTLQGLAFITIPKLIEQAINAGMTWMSVSDREKLLLSLLTLRRYPPFTL